MLMNENMEHVTFSCQNFHIDVICEQDSHETADASSKERSSIETLIVWFKNMSLAMIGGNSYLACSQSHLMYLK